MELIWNKAFVRIQNKEFGKLYIYGAGRAGLLTYLFLKEKGIDISGFIETIPKRKELFVLSQPISTINNISIKQDDIILISVMNSAHEILQNNCIGVCCAVSCITSAFFDENINRFDNDIRIIIEKENALLYRGGKVEKPVYFNEFSGVFENKDYHQRMDELLMGLQASDRQIIQKSAERIKKLVNNMLDEDCFDDNEKKKLLDSWDYCSKVNKVSDELWELDGRFLPMNDFRGEIFYDRLGMANVHNLEVLKNREIIDVGGYIGDSGLVLSEYTDKSVYIFEPIQKYFSLIKRTAEYNNALLKPFNMAASDVSGSTSLLVGEQDFNSTLQGISGRNYLREQAVQTISLDQFVEEYKLNIGLIKIHAEGAEQKVIRGAIETIEKQNPVIIVEINHTASDFFDIKPMLKKINPQYTFSVYKPANGFICMGEKLIAEVVN